MIDRTLAVLVLCAALVALVLITPMKAQQVPDQRAVPMGYQQIASFATAVSLTPPVGATAAVITISGTSVRYRDDGVAPTATVGVVLPVTTAGLPFLYAGTLSKIQFIPTASTSTLDILYYRGAGS